MSALQRSKVHEIVTFLFFFFFPPTLKYRLKIISTLPRHQLDVLSQLKSRVEPLHDKDSDILSTEKVKIPTLSLEMNLNSYHSDARNLDLLTEHSTPNSNLISGKPVDCQFYWLSMQINGHTSCAIMSAKPSTSLKPEASAEAST